MKISYLIVSFLFISVAIAKSDDQWNGQAIGPALSQNDANAYVDNVVQDWYAQSPNNPYGNIVPDQVFALANKVKPLGLSNLLTSYGKLAPVDPGATPDPKEKIKERVLTKAVSLTATSDDLDMLLGMAADKPLILAAFIDHLEWDSVPKVTAFLVTELGSARDVYAKSNLAPRYLIELAVRSQDSGVQAALLALISDATQNQSNYKNAHIFPDLIAKIAQHSTPALENTLPGLFEANASRAEISPTDRYNGISVSDATLNSQLFGGLAGLVIAKPTLCVDSKTKTALIALNNKLGGGGAMVMSLLVPAAASGDQTALQKIVAAYTSAPGKDPNAKKYLESIVSQPGGASLTEVINHLSTATYDPSTCLWTVTTSH